MLGPTAIAHAPTNMLDVAFAAQDYVFPGDTAASAALMAKLLGANDIISNITDKLALEGVLVKEDESNLSLQVDLVDSADARETPPLQETQPRAVEPLAVAPSDEAGGARIEEKKSHCCLENCDWIMPNLFLGGIEAAKDSQGLSAQGVRAVACCNRELEYPTSQFNPDLEYYRVDVEDMSREPIELFFPEVTEFIHSQLSQEKPVLVHCTAGVSRSASVLLAYLIEYGGYSLHNAFLLVLRHRPTITPNPGFMERLREYEKEKLGTTTSSVDFHKYLEWFQAPERCAQPDLQPDCA